MNTTHIKTGRTLVLSGAGPHIKIKLPDGTSGRVAIATGSKVKTVNLTSGTDFKFAA